LVITCVPDSAAARVWTDATGKSQVEAQYVKFSNGLVTLKLIKTGKVISIPSAVLCKDDQEYVREQATLAREKKEVALRPFDDAIQRDPTDPHLWLERGKERLKFDDTDDAIADLSKAISLAPGDCPAYNERGLALQSKGRLLEAHRDFCQAIASNLRCSAAFLNRGLNLRRLSRDRALRETPELEKFVNQRTAQARAARAERSPWMLDFGVPRTTIMYGRILEAARMDLERGLRLKREADAILDGTEDEERMETVTIR
jgi:tetratricopeptide (TPR) repeat protein